MRLVRLRQRNTGLSTPSPLPHAFLYSERTSALCFQVIFIAFSFAMFRFTGPPGNLVVECIYALLDPIPWWTNKLKHKETEGNEDDMETVDGCSF